jgi:hypothetical protein
LVWLGGVAVGVVGALVAFVSVGLLFNFWHIRRRWLNYLIQNTWLTQAQRKHPDRALTAFAIASLLFGVLLIAAGIASVLATT